MSDHIDIVARLSGMSADHGPDGWPAVQMRDITALCDEITRLRAALAQAGAGREPVAWQYRWTNPGNNAGSESDMEWKPVELRGDQTMQQRVDELRAWAYKGKPTYEVRALYAHPSPAQREPLSDAEVARLSDLPECWGDGSGADFLHVPFARQIEAACAAAWGVKLADSGTKGAARTDDTAPAAGERNNDSFSG